MATGSGAIPSPGQNPGSVSLAHAQQRATALPACGAQDVRTSHLSWQAAFP